MYETINLLSTMFLMIDHLIYNNDRYHFYKSKNFTFVPGITPSPIQLTCDITLVAAWIVNDVTVLLNQLDNIGHGRNGTNIVINTPMNNSEYFCSDGRNNGEPYYIFVAGTYVHKYVHYICITVVTLLIDLQT